MEKNQVKISSGSEEIVSNGSRKLIRAGDIVIIIIFLAAILAISFIKPYLSGNSGADTAEVTFGGEIIGIIPLSADGEYSFPQLAGMKFTVSDGTIFVSESDCSDHICVKSGRLSRPGEAAVCVPNRAAVTVRGSENENNVDAVVR